MPFSAAPSATLPVTPDLQARLLLATPVPIPVISNPSALVALSPIRNDQWPPADGRQDKAGGSSRGPAELSRNGPSSNFGGPLQ